MSNIFSRSVAAKMLLALMLILLAMSASYYVMNKRLNTIEVAFNDISRISNYAVSILRINKDIVEMQRDISVYGGSGSSAVFEKIVENFQSIKTRLSDVELKNEENESQIYLNAMSELVKRYGENLQVLTKRYEIRATLTEKELPRIYADATTHLDNLMRKVTTVEEKLFISEYLNLWHSLHRDAYLFLTKKDYAKRASVNDALRMISTKLNASVHIQKSEYRSEINQLSKMADTYSQAFARSIQANRNYLSLVNVVMAGDAIEFSTLANELREQSLTRLSRIKEEAEKTVSKTERILKLLAWGVLIYIIALSAFFHLQISKSIKRLTVSFKHFLNGDLSAPIYDLHRKDEIGVLAKAADSFRILSKDLSDAKQTAEHTTKVKSEFLANMSHEIRTPMNGILGMARQLSRTPLNAEQEKMLAIIHSSGASLLVIINDILDLSKIEASKIELEEQPIALNLLLDGLTHLFKAQANNKQVELFISVLPEDPNFIFLGDETRLKQVLINLIGNAIKFTERGSVSLNVSIHQLSNDEFSITFHVSDTGIGIAKEQLNSLFEAFSQADASITRRFGGTGLGLAISSKLLKLMGTSLHVESEYGVGSDFHFDLNVIRANESVYSEQHRMQEPHEQAIDFSWLNVLIVEDNEINQIVIEAMLSEFNISSINMADNGEQAILQCETRAFDLILMDMQMPVLDGPQATLRIREMPSYKNTPIIALTANVLSADKQRCIDAGMNDFIAKPINYECVKAILLKWCTKAADER
ncbi:response regulator [Pseudoalteromonas sp. MB41]|uniref:hybrid sensor histidine kinase/response regulator n=1 Tax=Pseudoalteromonas sp. MB41 TaxID=2896366 RepID=UPI001E5AB7BB|nr:ATP-binding protein [Pseudoalteromonas sp. MB41]MCC9659788.1 response regulator [Pseudoalteromonas sp. MB41]